MTDASAKRSEHMNKQTQQPVAGNGAKGRLRAGSIRHPKGTALVMVVVLTVLLAIIGVLFVMAARLDEMTTSSVVYDRDLDNAVDTVVELISQRLAEDVPGDGIQEPFDCAAPDLTPMLTDADRWLAPVEPGLRDNAGTPADYSDDRIWWQHASDLTGQISAAIQNSSIIYTPAVVVDPHADANDLVPADADGDGITDSYWVRLGVYDPVQNRFIIPYITSSRGKPVFAAVRIIDNCAMLNLNTASNIEDSRNWPDLEGRFLSSVSYRRFLRGSDATSYLPADPDSIMKARRWDALIDRPDIYHYDVLMHIDNPPPAYTLFDISDELEIRNRFMLTSPFEARFERKDVANFTFDAGGGIYSDLWIPCDPTNFAQWAWRVDPNNFDNQSGAYNDGSIAGNYEWRYDRRHVCTFYSFDRNLNTGIYPARDGLNNPVGSIFEPGLFDPDPLAVPTALGKPVWDPVNARYVYDLNNVETRVQILKLLYASRAWFLMKNPGWDVRRAARKACQFVANMIDYVDDANPATEGPFFNGSATAILDDGYGEQRNPDPTFIDRAVIRELIAEVSSYLGKGKPLPNGRNFIDIDVDTQYDFGIGVDDPNETIYGYERQPFISKIARFLNNSNGTTYYAIELCNPYDLGIRLEGWRIKVGDYTYQFTAADDVTVPAMSTSPTRQLGRLVLTDNDAIMGGKTSGLFELPPVAPVGRMRITVNDVIELQRPDPADTTGDKFITVDRTEVAQAAYVAGPFADVGNLWRVSKRDDTKWRFTNMKLHAEHETAAVAEVGLLSENNVTLNGHGWQLPVANNNNPIDTLHDFVMVLHVGNERDPNGTMMKPVTEHVAAAANEGDIRTDVVPFKRMIGPDDQITLGPLDYMCFLNRPEGPLPGRININTAPMEVIRAAIRDRADLDTFVDNETLARNIVDRRYSKGRFRRYRRITDLIDPVWDTGFTRFATDPNDNVGDPEMVDDFEERDWILSQVANLLTVRSDTFTAYILVRIGHDGPQRRMIAIFDRSNVTRDPTTLRPTAKPRLIALHPVPDPR